MQQHSISTSHSWIKAVPAKACWFLSPAEPVAIGQQALSDGPADPRLAPLIKRVRTATAGGLQR